MSSVRCRFRLAGIQASHGRCAVRGLVRRELAQMAVGELRLFGTVVERLELHRGRVQRGPAVFKAQQPEWQSTSTG